MGPWFWFWETAGVPDWVAQRLWLGTVMVAAGAGVLYLLRTLGIRHLPSVVAAALVYELSPYLLHYAARISVILLPWAALPWLLALTHRSLQRPRSWRHPAAFALVVATAGGVNATALVLAGLAPLVWVLWSLRTIPWRDVLAAVARIGVLSVVCSLWWMSGLWVQGGWGIDILRYTETVETVARTSLSSEVLRGLGYWFFYGGDKLGSWIEPGRSYTQVLPLLAVGFLVPVLAFTAASVLRWRHRTPFVVFVVLGTAVAVGAYPYDAPSPIGGAFKAFATSSTVGLALRSTPRAIPLVALGLAVLIGAALAARRATAIAVAVGAVAVLGIPPLWTGDVIGDNLQRDEDIPTYWLEAADALDDGDAATRVLELPGTDFASYRWGSTVDPITPGLIDRPYVARELIPYGTPASADLLIAFDRRLQEMVHDPASLAPIARLLGVGDIVLRSDLQYERYRTPRPRTLWASLRERTEGIGEPVGYGDPTPNRAIDRLPLRDEVYLSSEQGADDPPPVAVLSVEDPLPIVRARSASSPVLLAGDGEGLVEAAAAGLLGGDGVVLYSAALTDDERAEAVEDGALLVLTDTNRQRGRRWATMRDNAGYTESRGESPVRDDPSDNRLPLWPDARADSYTYVDQRGVRLVQASAYGNPVSFTPEDRPANAIDRDPTSAWRVGALDEVGGEQWVLEVNEPVTASSLEVVQPSFGNRWITKLEVVINRESVVTVDLDQRSFSPEGQRIDLPQEHEIERLELVIRGDNVGRLPRYDGYSGVGFTDIRIGDDPVRVDETTVLPTDLLVPGTEGRPLAIVLARMRSNPIEPTSGDEELAMSRTFDLRDDRRFDLDGQVRLSAALPDERIDAVLGGIIPVRASSRLRGDLMTRGASAVDGDASTAWTTGFGEQRGQWLEVEADEAIVVSSLDLTFLDDGDHSVPTKLRVSGGGESVDVDVPAGGGAVRLPRPIAGSPVRVEVLDVREVQTTDWYSERPITMPIGVVELGLGTQVIPPSGRIDDTCRADLLALDGAPVSVRLRGTVADALARRPIGIEPCGEITVPSGRHELRATEGATTGFDLDRLVLTDGVDASPGALPTAATDASIDVVSSGRASVTVDVSGDEPFWLVLGQSHSLGWSASDGLGEPTLVDGYANGWLVDPAEHDRITLTFTPQRTVNIALIASALGALLCLAILLLPSRYRSDVDPHRSGTENEPGWVWPWVSTGVRPGVGTVVAAGVAAGVVAAALVHPLTGVGIGAATVVGLVIGRGPGVLALGSITGLGLAASFTIAKQWRNDYPPDFGGPGFFGPAHHLAWIGLLLLAASVLSGELRRRAARRAPPSA
jgi:arabinofuranan 3-O-arabinosyltransferase